MTLQLFAHPFSSYCQKALIALYENATPFTFRMMEDPATQAEFNALWPIKRFPILLDGDALYTEATIIIEHLAVAHPGPVKLIPSDPNAAVRVREMDRFFDNYIAGPQQTFVFNALRPEGSRDPYGVEKARDMLLTAYAWLDKTMADREWAAGDAFSMADCGAAPQLFYADWTYPMDEGFKHLKAYRARLLARPSVVRAVNEARPYRHYFPLGAPDRD
jgi:glutathione S-transferase